MNDWSTRPAMLRGLWAAMLLVLLISVLAELFVDLHVVFGIEGSFGFHAWFGFLSCAALILVARLFGTVLKRRETYYADE